MKMLDRYAHITPYMQKETADAFGEMFFSAPIAIWTSYEKYIKSKKTLIPHFQAVEKVSIAFFMLKTFITTPR